FAMNVGHGCFGCGDQIQFPEPGRLVTFGQSIVLVLELWKLAYALQALRPDRERRRDLRISVLVRVQVEQKLDQSAFETGAPVRIQQKPAAGELRRASEINELETLAKLNV